ncbi:RNA polymerase Rpb1, domain 6-domain-containing protein, partial [Boletus edulis BED1]
IDDSSLELQAKLDEEYAQLVEDRRGLRAFVFPRSDGLTPHYLPVNLQRIIQNATQIFHINRDLEPAYIIDTVHQLMEQLLTIPEDPLSKEVQINSSLTSAAVSRRSMPALSLPLSRNFNQLLVNPGEMCGTLTAQ